jgi:hypothetical protein
MAKICINDEWFDHDFDRKPMSEALALEAATGMRYADWETELGAGSMKAMCGLVWLVWRRAGRAVDLKDILAGEVEIDLRPLLDSLQAIGEEAQEEPGPTTRGRSRPARTPTTGTAT